MTPNEMRDKTLAELEKLKNQWSEELFYLKIKKATGQLEKLHRIGQVKKDLARLITIKKEKLNKDDSVKSK